MAATKTPLQTISRRAGNYAPKPAPSPALLGDPAAAGSEEGAEGRRSKVRAGTARGGRVTPSARQGQLPFGFADERNGSGTGAAEAGTAKVGAAGTETTGAEAAGTRAAGTPERGNRGEPGNQKRVLACETVVVRQRTVVIERADRVEDASPAGLRIVRKPALRRIVLAEIDSSDARVVGGTTPQVAGVSASAGLPRVGPVSRENLPAPRRDVPIVLEAIGTVAITVLGLAAVLFLG